jgi:hypothetical protein
MRTIALSFVLLASVFGAAEPETPYTALAKLSADLSQNDAGSAIAYFDSSMKGYGDLARNIGSISAQATTLCAIDVVEDKDNNGVHTLNVDWYMALTSQGDTNYTERRREQVTLEMRQIKGKWKITSMSPPTILDPIQIR